MLENKIETIIAEIINNHPILKTLLTNKTIIEYLRPALEWNPSASLFTGRQKLEICITDEIKRLYGDNYAKLTKKQLRISWAVETGAHLNIPKINDKASKQTKIQLNPLIFQGQFFWAIGNYAFKRSINLSLNSGRVPLGNINSGAYIDLPSLPMPISTISRRYLDTPQIFIPAASKEELEKKLMQFETLKKENKLLDIEFNLANDIISNFLKIKSSFSDQVATTHALIFNKIIPPEIKQITLDSETVSVNYLIKILEDPSTITYKIFIDDTLRNKFIKLLSGISTGWSKDETPFYSVVGNNSDIKFVSYSGDLNPKILVNLLRKKLIWPKGVMKFSIMMGEAGICTIGGMNQAEYCTEIRDRLAIFFEDLGLKSKANSIKKMPTNIAVVSPCWGIDNKLNQFNLINGIETVLQPLTSMDIEKIKNITCKQSLIIAAPSLYNFLIGKLPSFNYTDLLPIIKHYAVIK